MRQLSPAAIDPYERFRQIVEAKHDPRRTRLRAISPEVQGHYQHYDVNKHELSAVVPVGYVGLQKEDLLNCYSVNTKPLDELKTRIRESQPIEIRGKCQYCCISAPDTFDHYLSFDEYPEFAVCALNLLPCCASCNRKKGQYLVIHGKRTIVNLYFDHLPAVRYLGVELIFKDGIPKAKYTLTQQPAITDALFELISAHFRRLNLLSDFSENSAEVFSEARSKVAAYLDDLSKAKIEDLLRREAERLSNYFSTNFWKAVLYEALAQSDDFLELCGAMDIAN
jgi:5-methylcytosine-specific restriction endonuclease McrA